MLPAPIRLFIILYERFKKHKSVLTNIVSKTGTEVMLSFARVKTPTRTETMSSLAC